MRTLEQRIKFDSGLSIGTHHIRLTKGDKAISMLAHIGPRGRVRLLHKPRDDDMYTSWMRLTGDAWKLDGPVIVWAARSPEFNAEHGALFTTEPEATLEV